MAVKKQRKSPKMHIRKKVFKFLAENGMRSTYGDYKKATRNPGISDTMFYNYRAKYLDLVPSSSVQSKVPVVLKTEPLSVASEIVSGSSYVTVYTKNILEGDEPILFLDDVREILNQLNVKVQIIEITNPRMIEVRKME